MIVLKGEQLMKEAATSEKGEIEVPPVILLTRVFEYLFIEPTEIETQNAEPNDPHPT